MNCHTHETVKSGTIRRASGLEMVATLMQISGNKHVAKEIAVLFAYICMGSTPRPFIYLLKGDHLLFAKVTVTLFFDVFALLLKDKQ